MLQRNQKINLVNAFKMSKNNESEFRAKRSTGRLLNNSQNKEGSNWMGFGSDGREGWTMWHLRIAVGSRLGLQTGGYWVRQWCGQDGGHGPVHGPDATHMRRCNADGFLALVMAIAVSLTVATTRSTRLWEGSQMTDVRWPKMTDGGGNFAGKFRR